MQPLIIMNVLVEGNQWIKEQGEFEQYALLHIQNKKTFKSHQNIIILFYIR